MDKLVADLRQRGYTLWLDVDERGIEPGEDWRKELVKQMSDAEAVIACVSPDFLESPYCRAEIEQAQREGKPIYPAIVRRLDDKHSLADFKLDHLQYTDLTASYPVGLQKLLVALPAPQQPLRNMVRTVSLIGAAIAVIVLVFAGVMLAVRGGIEGIQPTATPIPPTPTIDLQNYDVSVVVSYFVVDSPDKIAQADADAVIERFSKSLDQQLAAELGNSKLPLSHILTGPAGIPRITGQDADARQQAAIGVLNERKAKVAIYGVVHFNNAKQQLELLPEFYISTEQYFNDAQDLTGYYKFGQEIPADSLDDRDKLNTRVAALSYVMTGLFQHMTRQYDGALKSYQAALDATDWENESGQEIIQMLIGNSHMKLAEMAGRQCDRKTVLEQTEAAEIAFNKSKEIVTDYARAYAGLANVYAVRALWLPEDNDKCASKKINVAALRQAEDLVMQYQLLAQDSQEADLGIWRKMVLTEVQVHFLLWATQDRAARLDDNNAEYVALLAAVKKITDKYSITSSSTWANPVMEAYIFRGQARYARGQFRDGLDDYNEALKVYDNVASDSGITTQLLAPERAMTVHGLKGDAYFQLGEYKQAASEYYEALTMAKNLGVTGSIDSYEVRLKRADAYGTATPTRVPPTATATLEPSASPTEPPSPTTTLTPTATKTLTATVSPTVTSTATLKPTVSPTKTATILSITASATTLKPTKSATAKP